MAGHWACITRHDDPDTVAKVIGPFSTAADAKAHLADVDGSGLIDPGQFAATITDRPAITDDTNVRSLT